jgi:hypothetical protein
MKLNSDCILLIFNYLTRKEQYRWAICSKIYYHTFKQITKDEFYVLFLNERTPIHGDLNSIFYSVNKTRVIRHSKSFMILDSMAFSIINGRPYNIKYLDHGIQYFGKKHTLTIQLAFTRIKNDFNNFIN